MSGNGLTPTECVQTFVGLAFHADPRDVDAKRLGQARADLENERCDFRSLEHDRHIHVLDRKALSGIILGSETNKVLTHSHIPVLVLR